MAKDVSRAGGVARRAIGATVGLAAMCGIAAPALAQSQNDLVTQTGWFWWGYQDLQQIDDQIDAGYRIVDIEVEDDNPLKLSASFVRNTGDYAKGWWWYLGQTEAQVTQRMAQHNARLIDLEAYETPQGTRYAIVLIANTGQDAAVSHGFETNQTFNQVASIINGGSNRRIIDIQPQTVNGALRYDYIWVQNTGQLASNYAVYMNTTVDFISQQINNLNYRVVDLEPHEGTNNFTAILEPNDGNAWAWFVNMTVSDVDKLAEEYAGRITDLELYTNGNGQSRYATVVRRNDNDLTVDTAYKMRSFLPLSASSGFMLRRLDGNESKLAATRENVVFEPASLMKTNYLFAALNQIEYGADTLNTVVTDFRGINGSCPDGTNPQLRTLDTVLRDMMVDSDNPATETIRSRYGNAYIQLVNGLAGNPIDINHTIGCFCNSTRNELTLDGLYAVHNAVQDGSLGDSTADFYDIMLNGSSFTNGTFSTVTTRDDVLNSSSLTAQERNEFRSFMEYAHKGGSYSCSGSVANAGQFRSKGAYVTIPFRSGCRVLTREYFIGAWANDGTDGDDTLDAVGTAINNLYRDILEEAVASWETAICPCGPGDYNGDGTVDIFDIVDFLAGWNNEANAADRNGDGEHTIFDILEFLEDWNQGCN